MSFSENREQDKKENIKLRAYKIVYVQFIDKKQLNKEAKKPQGHIFCNIRIHFIRLRVLNSIPVNLVRFCANNRWHKYGSPSVGIA